MQPDPSVLNRWSGAASFWEKNREMIRQMFAPVTQALAEEAAIGPGDTVLDVATGPGEPSCSIAALTGPAGKVFGIDPVPEMVAAARRAAVARGLGNAQFTVAFADPLPFPSDVFDAVVSRFGVMFFPSPLNGVREMLRVLKPGGRFALAVWHTAETNPFFDTLQRVIDQHVDSPPPDPDAPDAFRFASAGKLRDVVAAAGAADASERLHRFTIHAPIPSEAFWNMRFEMSEKLREKVAGLSKEQLLEVKRQALAALAGHSTETGMRFPAEVLIVSGKKR